MIEKRETHTCLPLHKRKPPVVITQKYNRWTVIGQHFYIRKRRKSPRLPYCVVRCDCGNTEVVWLGNLKNDSSTQCVECANKTNITHGMKKTKTYTAWTNMKMRCKSSYTKDRYAGITMDPKWNEFTAFLRDVGECPPGMTIDRIDNNKGYYPGNVRWVTNKENQRNKSTNHRISLLGGTYCVVEASELPGAVGTDAIRSRLKLGWDTYDAVFRPIGSRSPVSDPTVSK